ncbi:small integral membrane protein 4 [Micropterus dolomieu]|uniref:small integral membrane protein 4 n=1 Tax=Micropterus dolomieu TaxID=147949 RepID=UPI001E8E8168|nr:small integral membrane protein 4 [Micropterus dolomieu]
MLRRSKNLSYVLSLVPGKRRLGTYRFLPIFFCIGGVMEWIMINVRIGKETFCECKMANWVFFQAWFNFSLR